MYSWFLQYVFFKMMFKQTATMSLSITLVPCQNMLYQLWMSATSKNRTPINRWLSVVICRLFTQMPPVLELPVSWALKYSWSQKILSILSTQEKNTDRLTTYWRLLKLQQWYSFIQLSNACSLQVLHPFDTLSPKSPWSYTKVPTHFPSPHLQRCKNALGASWSECMCLLSKACWDPSSSNHTMKTWIAS